MPDQPETENTWPLWMTSEQADRIAETLQRNGFTNVSFKDDEKVLRTTATDPEKGDSYTVRVGTPTELWMIEGRFKSWRPKRG